MRFYYKENIINRPAIMFEETQPLGFTLITDHDTLVDLHFERYTKAKNDGIDFSTRFQAKLYIMLINGLVTLTETDALQSYLSDLRKDLEGGDWLTAQGRNQTIELNGIYDQALKDEIQLGIDTYILNNY